MVGAGEEMPVSYDIAHCSHLDESVCVFWSQSWTLWGSGPFSLPADPTPCASDPVPELESIPLCGGILSEGPAHLHPFPSLPNPPPCSPRKEEEKLPAGSGAMPGTAHLMFLHN